MDAPLTSDHAPTPACLAQITTIWTNILKARGGPDEADAEELRRFFDRYQRPILNYLRRCVSDDSAASDLFQEFALRFVRGDFAGSRPRSGSFRQYLKTSLANLVRDHQLRNAKAPRPWSGHEPQIADVSQQSDLIDHALRDELLGRAWELLQLREASGDGSDYSILRERVTRPELTAAQLGIRLAELQIRPEAPDEALTRKLVQRAREEFAEQLLQATQQMLGGTTWEPVEAELAQLGLLQYCERTLRNRKITP